MRHINDITSMIFHQNTPVQKQTQSIWANTKLISELIDWIRFMEKKASKLSFAVSVTSCSSMKKNHSLIHFHHHWFCHYFAIYLSLCGFVCACVFMCFYMWLWHCFTMFLCLCASVCFLLIFLYAINLRGTADENEPVWLNLAHLHDVPGCSC